MTCATWYKRNHSSGHTSYLNLQAMGPAIDSTRRSRPICIVGRNQFVAGHQEIQVLGQSLQQPLGRARSPSSHGLTGGRHPAPYSHKSGSHVKSTKPKNRVCYHLGFTFDAVLPFNSLAVSLAPLGCKILRRMDSHPTVENQWRPLAIA